MTVNTNQLRAHSRRTIFIAMLRLGGLATIAASLSACMPVRPFTSVFASRGPLFGGEEGDLFDLEDHYAARPEEDYPVPAVPYTKIDPQFLRQRVNYQGEEQPGSIVVDPDNRYLYLVENEGSALRYGVGVGREGFGWDGSARIGRKAAWPRWTPPSEMIARRPDLEEFRTGMPPGIDNPLGARALYLYQGKRDTLFRLHGTNESDSIGQAVSSGCIRMFNQDIIDLYARAPVGTEVIVLPYIGSS